MGLLERARVLDENPALSAGSRPQVQVENLIASFRHSTDHLDYPVALFHAFRSLLGFSRGALLFPDHEKDEFFPWLTKGMDRTSSRRLRLPKGFPALANNGGDSIIEVNSEDLAPMLSNRDSALSGPACIIPLGEASGPDGLILVLEAEGITAPDFMEAAAILNRKLGPGVAVSRRVLEIGNQDDPVSPAEWLENWGDRNAWLVNLDATGAIESLLEAVEGLEIYRARRDVIGLIRRINGRMGRTCDLKDGRILILFPEERMPDRELYLHQLGTAFSASILNLTQAPELPAVFFRWPEQRNEVKAALSGHFGE